MKIKFLKRSKLAPMDQDNHIIVTYSLFEIFLGALLVISNVAVIYILINYTIK